MILEGILVRAVQMSTPLLLGSLGEVIVERTGVMNMAIEGIFLLGAWAGFTGAYITGSLAAGFLGAIAAGVVVGALYGWITVFLKQHQIVTGVALNILAAGIGIFFYRVLFGVPLLPLTVEPLRPLAVPLLSDIPILGPALFRQNILTYLAWGAMPLGWWVLFRTRTGLVLRSTGADPEAVDAAGLSVERVRFGAVLAASALSGLAGAFYSIGYLGLFSNDMIGGRGWIAFALCFLGNWNPLGALLGAVVFGVADAAAITLQTSGIRMVPNEFLIALPYMLTIAATVARKRFNVPASLGTAYFKEEK
ncbi:MAG: ral nucleoside transport system permease protein [Synergistaceae bacterium]|nr:ral nucleoside transport system permease protein [Synergistaceae bacterium]